MFDTKHRLPFVAAALLFVGFAACSSSSPGNKNSGGSGGEEETGGTTGTGGKATGTGGKATGGSTGSTGGSTGTTGGSTGSTGGSTGTTGGSTGSTGGSTGSTGGSTGTGGATGTGGSAGTGDGGMAGAVLACWPDPKVVKICHQLENACENCGPKKAVACNNGANPKVCACFDLVNKAYAGMATDADCEKYFNENQCVVDNAATTGNTCGSLDCTNAACNGKFGGKTCEEAKGWGDSSICNSFYAKCPCK